MGFNQSVKRPGGYMGKVLRVDLDKNKLSQEQSPNEEVLRKYIGGTGLGAKYLYEEVAPGVQWWSPENRLMLFSGPLGGTRVFGSGTICGVTKGAMTEDAGTSQANGFFGAYLKFCGFDGIILQGAAERWCYLYIDDGKAELRDASHLLGKDCWETEDILRQEVGRQCSICTIGPSGENKVRFAAIICDYTHVFSKNGMGAVMGAKRLKAIVVTRGKRPVPVKDPKRLKEILSEGRQFLSTYQGAHPLSWSHLSEGGTAWHFDLLEKLGTISVKNLTTNIFPEAEKFKGANIRAHFRTKPSPCWACPLKHVSTIEITEGPYKGFSGYEPEFEQLVSMGPQIGVADPAKAIVLADLVDRLGLDVNEAGWVIGWVMECYEAGLLTRDDLDGLEMTWGNVEATRTMLSKIAHRQGIGDLLAEGVKRAAHHVGGDTLQRGVWIETGTTLRASDYRAGWHKLIDQAFSNTGSSEVGAGTSPAPGEHGFPPAKNPYVQYEPKEVSTQNAQLNGIRQWNDSLPVCIFLHQSCFQLTVDCLNAVTGWDSSTTEAIETGKRIVNLLRVFNLRHGRTKEMEVPSARLFSAPKDGPAVGITALPHWDFMQRNYYKHMGWDPETGRPLPETLTRLGLAHLIPDA